MVKYLFYLPILAVIQTFSITEINSTAVRADWGSVTGANHFTVYYQSTSQMVKQMTTTFPGNSTEGIIKGLDPILDYLFSISISLLINGNFYEGKRSQLIQLSKANTIIIILLYIIFLFILNDNYLFSGRPNTTMIPSADSGSVITIIVAGTVIPLILVLIVVIIIVIVVLVSR